MQSPFALYRLPHADHYVRVEGSTQEYYAMSQLNGVAGFVMAPFQTKQSQPVVLIHPDRVDTMALPAESEVPGMTGLKEADGPSLSYTIDFANFHAQLQCGTFQKIVLARCVEEKLPSAVDPSALFFRACSLYPRLFIALVYTPQSGMWLTATPEILLEGQEDQWRTIALAGTMRLSDDRLDSEGETQTWDTKNIAEQRIVSTYIAECLEQFTRDFKEEGPRTVRAANLVHLRSDFTFTLPDHDHLGDLIGRLHPTPAVCGLPKRDTFEFIVHNEHTPRRYYSGFMGPLQMSGTHLYVSLRCMNIDGERCHLFAGGGLLRDSVMEQEWQETEAKLETMRRCIATSRT